MLANPALLLTLFAPQGEEPPVLEVGVPREVTTSPDDPEVRDEQILSRGTWVPVRTRRLRFVSPATGRYSVTCEATLFATFVAVRDSAGTLVGWNPMEAGRTTSLDLEAGATYFVDCGGALGATGTLRITMLVGGGPDLTSDENLERARTILELRSEHYGQAHPQVAAALDHFGYLLYRKSDYRSALPLMERALEIWAGAYGDTHPMTAYGRWQVGAQLIALGEYHRARHEYEACLSLRETVLGPTHVETLKAHNQLGDLALRERRLDDAERHFRHAIEHADARDPTRYEREQTLIWRSNLVRALYRQGRYLRARDLAAETLTESQLLLGENDPRIASQLDTLGGIELRLGHASRAETLQRRALASRRRALPPGHSTIATSLNNLAVVLVDTGRPDEAEPLLEECLQIYRDRLGEHWYVGVVLANLGDNLLQQGRVADGEQKLRDALDLFGRLGLDRHANTAITIRYLGTAALESGRWDEAERSFRDAIAIQTGALGPHHPDTLKSTSYLGQLLRRAGRFDEALPIYRDTISHLTRTFGPAHPDVVSMTEGLGILEFSRGRRAEAHAALIASVSGRWRHLAGELVVSSSEDRFRQAAHLQTTLDVLLSAARTAPTPDVVDAAFEWRSASRGIVFRHALREREHLRADDSPATAALLDSLERTRARLAQLAYATDVDDPDAHAQTIATLHEKKEQLERELGETLGTAPLDEQVRVTDLAARLPDGSALVDFCFHRSYVFTEIVDGAVVSEEALGDRRLLAWVVRSGEQHAQLVDLGRAEPIETAIESYVRDLVTHRSRRRRGEADKLPNDALRALLWEPVEEALGAADLVFVAADGELAKLPLGTLQRADGRFLIEGTRFVSVQDPISLDRLLLEPPATRDAAPTLLALGAVDYQDAALDAAEPDPAIAVADATLLRQGFDDFWPSLPATRGEVEALSHLHGGRFADAARLALTDADATKARLVAAAPRFDVLHLATHGFFEPAGLPSLWEQALAEARESTGATGLAHRHTLTGYPPGLLAGLVLAGANRETGREQAILTAEETMGLDLEECDLVVLSACETALGEMMGGEGMLSLRRAFHEAGARTVVSSLWSVRDDATARLMRAFYTNLWEHGRSPLHALRDAQLAMLELNRRRHDGDGMPSTWGAFVLSGEWR